MILIITNKLAENGKSIYVFITHAQAQLIPLYWTTSWFTDLNWCLFGAKFIKQSKYFEVSFFYLGQVGNLLEAGIWVKVDLNLHIMYLFLLNLM